MTPIGMYDPDYITGGTKRPSWATPKTALAKEALAACGRLYFRGTTKHNSEYADWDEVEQKVIGASDECYLQRMFIKNVIDWVKSKNVKGTIIGFRVLLSMIRDPDRQVDFMSQNRDRLLAERKNNIPSVARINMDNDDFLRKIQQMEESDE